MGIEGNARERGVTQKEVVHKVIGTVCFLKVEYEKVIGVQSDSPVPSLWNKL